VDFARVKKISHGKKLEIDSDFFGIEKPYRRKPVAAAAPKPDNGAVAWAAELRPWR
jgi:hypothetical protein